MDSGRVLNITIDRAGILEYGDVSQLQEMFIDYNDQRTSIYNKDPFGTNGTSIVPMKAELPEDFKPSICAVVNNDSELRRFLTSTEQMNKETLKSQKNRLNTNSSGDLSKQNPDDTPDWQLLAQVGRYENDQFSESIYKYKLPNTFEFVTKDAITNTQLVELIKEARPVRSPKRVSAQPRNEGPSIWRTTQSNQYEFGKSRSRSPKRIYATNPHYEKV